LKNDIEGSENGNFSFNTELLKKVGIFYIEFHN